MEISAFQDMLRKKAKAAGFWEIEIYYENSKSLEVLVYDGEVSHYENSMAAGVSFRGIYKNKIGYSYSEKIDEKAADYLIEQAKQNAEIMEEETQEFLYWGDREYTDVKGFNEQLEAVSVEQMIKSAKEMEMAAKQEDETVAAIDYCLLGYGQKGVSIKNSKGLDVAYCTNCGTAFVSAIAQNEKDIKTGSEYWVDNRWETFWPKQTGKKAAQTAVGHLGAYSVASGEYRVILENNVMASLLETFSGIFFGENVQKGFSLLKDKKGEKIASSKVTIKDDPLLIGQVGSVPFDSEGVKCFNKAVVEDGRLRTLLYNLKSSKKEGLASTGNGFRASYRSPIQTTCTNFYIKNGAKSQDSLLALLGDGLMITEIAGLHSGANTISGDFSLCAEGFLVEKGRKKRPVEQITIAGNFYELLKNIEELGNNLRFQMPGASGRTGAPMVLVKHITVSGA